MLCSFVIVYVAHLFWCFIVVVRGICGGRSPKRIAEPPQCIVVSNTSVLLSWEAPPDAAAATPITGIQLLDVLTITSF